MIIDAMTSLQNSSIQDFLDLSPIIHKKVIMYVVLPLCHIFNKSLSEGIVPYHLNLLKFVQFSIFQLSTHRQVIDRYLTNFSHASSYRKILRAMRILCGNQNAMVIAFCRFCNIIKLHFFSTSKTMYHEIKSYEF